MKYNQFIIVILLIQSLQILGAQNKENVNTRLMDAIKANDELLVSKLLTEGADPDFFDDKGKTPLMYVRSKSLFNMLIDAGANPLKKDNHYYSVMYYIISNLKTSDDIDSILRFFIGKGVSIDENIAGYYNEENGSPLRVAANIGSGRAILTLLDLGADPFQTSKNGTTILHTYCMENTGEDPALVRQVLETLIAMGVDPSTKNNSSDDYIWQKSALISALFSEKLGQEDDLFIINSVSKETLEEARNELRAYSNKEFKSNLPSYLFNTIIKIIILIVINGLSILMREYIFKEATQKNWMAAINGISLLTSILVLVEIPIFFLLLTILNLGMADQLYGIGFLFIGINSLILGIFIYSRPIIHYAFENKKLLYYITPIISSFFIIKSIINIWPI